MSQNVEIHGIVPSEHVMVSDIENQIIQGQLKTFELEPMSFF